MILGMVYSKLSTTAVWVRNNSFKPKDCGWSPFLWTLLLKIFYDLYGDDLLGERKMPRTFIHPLHRFSFFPNLWIVLFK